MLAFIKLEHGHANPGRRMSIDARMPAWPRPLSSVDVPDVVTVTPASSLLSVLELMSRLHIHRVYVVDSRSRPVGVITQSDVLGLAYVHATMRAPPGALDSSGSLPRSPGSTLNMAPRSP